MKVHHGCPVQATINVLSGKWKVQAVRRLSFGPLRFAELRNLLRGGSERVLTAQLRELEKDGVVNRRAARSSPPKVTYSLSPSGQTLIPLLEGLCDWGSKQLASPQICPAIGVGCRCVRDAKCLEPQSIKIPSAIYCLCHPPRACHPHGALVLEQGQAISPCGHWGNPFPDGEVASRFR
jgi:DNA-binding HxlR family transcriptional regulator